jgi:hypothetical protein
MPAALRAMWENPGTNAAPAIADEKLKHRVPHIMATCFFLDESAIERELYW